MLFLKSRMLLTISLYHANDKCIHKKNALTARGGWQSRLPSHMETMPFSKREQFIFDVSTSLDISIISYVQKKMKEICHDLHKKKSSEITRLNNVFFSYMNLEQ